jgi:hypothetical protein
MSKCFSMVLAVDALLFGIRMQWRLVRGGRYGSADPEIYLKRTQFKTVHL